MSKQNGGIIGPDNVTTGGFTGVASGVFKLGEVTKLIRESKWPEPSPFPVNITPNSARFNNASSDYLNRTPSSASNRKTFTFSFWVKRNKLGIDATIYNVRPDSNGANRINFHSGDSFRVSIEPPSKFIFTTRLFRDVSAWYHIVVAFDTTQGTAANRVKIYVNGVQETSLVKGDGGAASYPDQNSDLDINTTNPINIGRDLETNSDFIDMYLAEFVFIDGQQLAPTSFGETNSQTGIWVPKTVTGLTFGTNGFYLDFKDSSALGNDANGSNNFTVNNLTSLDQTTDSPSNNWCTWNFLDRYYTQAVFSDGNCTVQTPNASETYCTSTFKMSSGKWYAEISTYDGSNRDNIGIVDSVATANNGSNNLYQKPKGYSYRGWTTNPGVWNNDSKLSGTFASYSSPNTIGVAVDLDNNLIYFSKDGVWQNSADPSSGTGGVSITAAASLSEGAYFFAVGDEVTSDDTTYRANFGNPAYALTSAVADGNGFGQFEYTPPTGFFSLCTNNLNVLE